MFNRFTQYRSAGRPLRGRVGMIAAGLAAAMLVVAGCSPDNPTPDTPPNRVLQAVNVQMTPDGTTTGINGTAVSVRDTAADATTEDTTYSPREVADDLPVRVTTSYRTAKRTGTNLSDLKGYSGQIEIDLTVQNLTMKAQDLTYDVAGTSKTQPALVGSPLTVVASTTLPKTTPTNVITASAPGDSAATNGVLSQGDKGGSVVQWATLLAPPQTGANATLRLVADAKDFQVPTFDLSVQPGLVTDPSVGGVLESAFNEDPQSQLALEQRTIKLITEVNDTLTRASNNISNVRKNLDSTSNTLGTRSLQELKTSTKGVATSMKGLDKELTGLNKDISGTLTSSQSTVLQQLGDTVSTMDAMLGDTSMAPPTPQVDRNGCKTVVKEPEDAGSVYGNLMEVTAQLDGYATATKECKKAAQAALVRSVGPEKPNDEICKDQPSTTCALYATEQKFSAIMDDLVAQGDDLVDSLQPEVVNNAMDEYRAMASGVTDVQDNYKKLTDIDPYGNVDKQLDQVDDALTTVDTQTDEVSTKVGEINGEASKALNEIRPNSNNIGKQEGNDPGTGEPTYTRWSLLWKNERAAQNVCALLRNDPFGEGSAEWKVNKVHRQLVGRDCPEVPSGDDDNNADDDDNNDNEVRPVTPDKDGHSVEAGLLKQAEAWDSQTDHWNTVLSLSDTRATKGDGAGKAIADLKDDISTTKDQVKDVRAALDEGKKDLGDRQDALSRSIAALDKHTNALGDDMDALKKQQDNLAPTIDKAFNNAADEANKQVSDAIDPQIRKVTTQAQVDSKAVGEMFDESAAGLSNAADKITRNGTRTVENQRRELKASEKHASGDAADRVDKALTQMAKGVSSSNRDMNSASAQLADSLNKVLLDLGSRKVNGSGLLGSMTTSAAKVGTADYQLALASASTTSYANVRSEDINGILLRQAQLQASLHAAADLPAFHLDVPSGAQSQTVYTFRIEVAK